MTDLGIRIREAAEQIGGLNTLAERLAGTTRRTLTDYVAGKSEPKVSTLLEISRATSTAPNWLLTGKGNMFPGSSPERIIDHSEAARDMAIRTSIGDRTFDAIQAMKERKTTQIEAQAASGMIALPWYQHVKASAGPGALPDGNPELSSIAFQEQYLRDLGATPGQCAVITAQGESMSPGIPDGALLIIDRSQIEVEHDRIYVFNVGEAVVVKRAIWSFSRELKLKSDNPSPSYPDETFNEENAETLNVVGRVVFHGRKV